MFEKAGLLEAPVHISLVMGVASGMPANAAWLPLLVDEMPPDAKWQSIVIGRTEFWDVHRATAELGGHVRTGVEDTFYLPDGSKTPSNGPLVKALVDIVRSTGREVANAEEARTILGVADHA